MKPTDSIRRTLAKMHEALRVVIVPSQSGECLLSLWVLKAVSDLARQNTALAESVALPLGGLLPELLARRKEPGNAQRIRDALTAIERANPGFFTPGVTSNLFEFREGADGLIANKQLARVLKMLAAQPSVYNLSRNHQATLVEALSANIEWAGRNGSVETATPTALAELIAELAQPTAGDRIYDPNAGLGLVLLACSRRIREQGARPRQLWGQELSDRALALAQMFAFLEGGEPLELNAGDVFIQPSFPKEAGALDRQFDLIVSSIPLKLGDWPRPALNEEDPWLRFRYVLPPQGRSDLAYLQHMLSCIESLHGRLVVSMPPGVLYRQREDELLRRAIVQDNLLETVIAFTHPLMNKSFAMLCFRAVRTTNEILMIDATDITSSLFEIEALPKIQKAWSARTNIPGFCALATPTQIETNQWSLQPQHYVGRSDSGHASFDFDASRARVRAIDKELANVRQQLDHALDSLGGQ